MICDANSTNSGLNSNMPEQLKNAILNFSNHYLSNIESKYEFYETKRYTGLKTFFNNHSRQRTALVGVYNSREESLSISLLPGIFSDKYTYSFQTFRWVKNNKFIEKTNCDKQRLIIDNMSYYLYDNPNDQIFQDEDSLEYDSFEDIYLVLN